MSGNQGYTAISIFIWVRRKYPAAMRIHVLKLWYPHAERTASLLQLARPVSCAGTGDRPLHWVGRLLDGPTLGGSWCVGDVSATLHRWLGSFIRSDFDVEWSRPHRGARRVCFRWRSFRGLCETLAPSLDGICTAPSRVFATLIFLRSPLLLAAPSSCFVSLRFNSTFISPPEKL